MVPRAQYLRLRESITRRRKVIDMYTAKLRIIARARLQVPSHLALTIAPI